MANGPSQQFRLSYELSPIILTNGIAANLTGGALPIINLLGDADIDTGFNQDGRDNFSHFQPIPGGSLIDNEIGRYPFANQAVASNSTIANPLVISLLMLSPVNQQGGYADKINRLTSLKSSLDAHTAAGGTYTVATPGFIYTNCILLSLRDVTKSGPGQPQSAWQWDFIKPLLTLEDAAAAMNALLSKIDASQPTATPAPALSDASAAVAATATPDSPGGVVTSALGTAAPAWSSVATMVGAPTSALGAITQISGGSFSNNLIGGAVSGVTSTLQGALPSIPVLPSAASAVAAATRTVL
jgi:hypothetical protein